MRDSSLAKKFQAVRYSPRKNVTYGRPHFRLNGDIVRAIRTDRSLALDRSEGKRFILTMALLEKAVWKSELHIE